MVPGQKLNIFPCDCACAIARHRKSLGGKTRKRFGKDPRRTQTIRSVRDVLNLNRILVEYGEHEIVERSILIPLPDFRNDCGCGCPPERAQLEQSIPASLQTFCDLLVRRASLFD